MPRKKLWGLLLPAVQETRRAREALGMALEKSLVGICFKFDRGWSKTTPRRLTI